MYLFDFSLVTSRSTVLTAHARCGATATSHTICHDVCALSQPCVPTAVPPQLPTPSSCGECRPMPACKASTGTKVGRGKAQEAAQTINPRAHPKKKARTAVPKSDPAQSRLPVVWQPFGESQPSQQSAEQPNAGLATAPISGFALSAPPSEVLALVPCGALPQPPTPLAVVPDGALPQLSTPPSATAGPGPDTPSQPMAPPPAAGLPV